MSDLYQRDLVSWAKFQATLIREGSYETLEFPWIAEELEGIRSCHMSLLRHALVDLCFCIALCRARPETHVYCYVQAGEAGVRLDSVLRCSPSLEEVAREFLDDAWKIGVGRVEEMFPHAEVRPASLGYTLNALLNHAHTAELDRHPVLGMITSSAKGDSGSDE